MYSLYNERPLLYSHKGLFRATVKFTGLQYSSNLADRNTPEYQQLAAQVESRVEDVYASTPGKINVNVVDFRWVKPGHTFICFSSFNPIMKGALFYL